MTQRDLFAPENNDELADLLLLLALASAAPLAGTVEGGEYLEGPAPLDEAESDRVYLDEADIRLPYTAEEQYERECYEGDPR